MYKRRLRLALVAQDGKLAAQAAEACAQYAAQIEPRAGTPQVSALLDWADLVLTLDDAARDALPPLPTRVQVRHCPLDPARWHEQFAARIQGVAGGLRILERGGNDS